MKKHIFLFLIALFCSVAGAMAQKTVSGNVADASGEPLIGVSVTLQGSNTGAVTDIDGNYSLANVPSDGVIKFSYFGMASQDIKVDGRSTINVVMKEDNLHLDEEGNRLWLCKSKRPHLPHNHSIWSRDYQHSFVVAHGCARW